MIQRKHGDQGRDAAEIEMDKLPPTLYDEFRNLGENAQITNTRTCIAGVRALLANFLQRLGTSVATADDGFTRVSGQPGPPHDCRILFKTWVRNLLSRLVQERQSYHNPHGAMKNPCGAETLEPNEYVMRHALSDEF